MHSVGSVRVVVRRRGSEAWYEMGMAVVVEVEIAVGLGLGLDLGLVLNLEEIVLETGKV